MSAGPGVGLGLGDLDGAEVALWLVWIGVDGSGDGTG